MIYNIGMKKIVLKIKEGDIFRFFESEERSELSVGSKRTCDVVIRSQSVQPVQVRLLCKNDIWYAEDLSKPGCRCLVTMGKKVFKRPVLKFDSNIILSTGEGKNHSVIAEISAVKQIRQQKNRSAFDLTAKTVTSVGSDIKNDIRVDNPLVSKRHFFIVYDDGSCFVEDARSLHGTFVNNRKIKRSRLNDYDRISIPGAAYVFFKNKLLYSTSDSGIRIDAADISKEVVDKNTRRKIKLVSDLSFRIEAGEFVAVVGGSGAGKSTMLDCLNGMRPATGGKIYFDSNDYYENMNSYKGVIGYVPQKDIMHEDLTVQKSLTYTAMLRTRADITKEEIRERVSCAIEDVRLQGKENLKISSLSGGQKKRVSIAMELLSDPKVIFLDEPTSGLSPDLDLEMMQLLKELSKKGRTIVAITHAMDNLDKCDKVMFLGKNGRLCYYGRADGAFAFFNRKSYSRIFEALRSEKISEYFAKKYRSSSGYKKLYSVFVKEYGEGCILPPETVKAEIDKPKENEGKIEKPDMGGKKRRSVKKKAKIETNKKDGFSSEGDLNEADNIEKSASAALAEAAIGSEASGEDL